MWSKFYGLKIFSVTHLTVSEHWKKHLYVVCLCQTYLYHTFVVVEFVQVYLIKVPECWLYLMKRRQTRHTKRHWKPSRAWAKSSTLSTSRRKNWRSRSCLTCHKCIPWTTVRSQFLSIYWAACVFCPKMFFLWVSPSLHIVVMQAVLVLGWLNWYERLRKLLPVLTHLCLA